MSRVRRASSIKLAAAPFSNDYRRARHLPPEVASLAIIALRVGVN